MGTRRRSVRVHQRARARQREDLERAFADILEPHPELASLVVAKSAQREPYHRWLSYRQGFAPALVRRFLERAEPVAGPILDPFSGSGTVVTECARQGIPSVGVDAVPSLVFVTRARFCSAPPPWDLTALADDVEVLRKEAQHPLRLSALLLAAAAGTNGEGHARQDAPPFLERVKRAWQMICEDTATPLPTKGLMLVGDARALPLADACLGGAICSPPYLSRYDYSRINDPMESLKSGRGRRRGRRSQLRASRVARGSAASTPAAAEEAAASLDEAGDDQAARTVRTYASDVERMVFELARTLRPKAPAWIVIGGAEVKKEYVPSDLIVARSAEEAGFRVEALHVARNLRPTGRRLGSLTDIAPREVLVQLRRTH